MNWAVSHLADGSSRELYKMTDFIDREESRNKEVLLGDKASWSSQGYFTFGDAKGLRQMTLTVLIM